MASVSIKEAQADLSGLIHALRPGDEIVITENDQPIAKLVAQLPGVRKPRRRGSAKGKLVLLSEDDQHLENFKDYMP